MAIKRKIAFKKEDGTFWGFNSSKTALMGISPQQDTWMSTEELQSLNAEQYKLLSGLEMVIYTPIEDDEYTTNIETYGIVETTEETHIPLHGYSGINGITADGSSTCHFLFSFDNKNTWVTYDSVTRSWKTVLKSHIYSEGTTLSVLNTLNKNDWGKIFQRTQLDYAIAVTTKENISNVQVALPENSAPSIVTIGLDNSVIHKEESLLKIKVDDIDGDKMHYKLFLNGEKTPKFEDDVNPFSKGNLNFIIPAEWLNVGENTLKFFLKDEKGLESNKAVKIIKTNNLPQVTTMIDNDIFSFTISDAEGDTVQYRILLNGEEIVPMGEFQKVPIGETIALPRNKIIFGKKNRITLEYQDDIKEKPLCSTDVDFVGYYYGILFTTTAVEDKKDAAGNLLDDRFYTGSLGKIAHRLIIPHIIRGRESSTYEIRVLNRSAQTFQTATIFPEKINDHMEIQISDVQSPFDPKPQLIFPNIKFNESESFFMRVVSKDNFSGDFEAGILAEGKA